MMAAQQQTTIRVTYTPGGVAGASVASIAPHLADVPGVEAVTVDTVDLPAALVPADDIPEFGPLFADPGQMVLGETLGQWTAPEGFVMVGVAMAAKSAAAFLGLDPVTMDTPDHDPRGTDPRERGAL